VRFHEPDYDPMSWRRAALYWAGFLVLAAYYVAIERQPRDEAAAHLLRAPFLNVPDGQVEAVELTRGAHVVRCRRVEGRWQVVEPAGHAAPSDLVAALVANLSQAPDVEVVAESGANLVPFGLAPPDSQIVLTVSGGAPIVVRLGDRNPAGTAIYARRTGSDSVYLVGLNVRYYEDLLFEAVAGS